jgi:hypothetical protein
MIMSPKNSFQILRSILSRTLFFVFLISLSIFAGESDEELAKSLITHVKYLASDTLEGRGTGLKGNEKAAEYIMKFFRENDVDRLGKTYYQKFETITEVKTTGDNFASLFYTVSFETQSFMTSDINEQSWKVGEDYTPLGFSTSANVTSALVFVGYGISSEELDFDEYHGVDVNDKIVIVLKGTPEDDNPHSEFVQFDNLRYKATNAREHGAKAIIYVNPEQDSSEELMKLSPNRSGSDAGIIAIHAKRMVIDILFGESKPLSQIVSEINDSKKPHSFEMNDYSLNLSVKLEHIEKPTANVIGYIRGTNPALSNEYLIVGAHFDHLGWGGENSRYPRDEPAIHHGADDNASGTAAMLELAKNFSKNPVGRPVIFMGFTGEEYGLLGSAYYTRNPLVPLDETIFMLNLDMIGRQEENKINVHGSGTSSRWEPMLDSLGTIYNFEISTSSDGWGPSDHSSFYGQNMPVLFLFTGLHRDYHMPSDTWEKLDYQGMAQIVRFSESIIQTVANDVEKPDFIKTSSPGARRAMAFKVYTGTIPDYSDHPKGLRLTGVREGGPAEKAGLKGGDVIIKFGDLEIKNIYDYTYALGKYKPGETIDVVVLRGENEDQLVTLSLTLEKRN